MTINILLSGLVFLLLSFSDVNAKNWRGIVPLKSTRADVERLLGASNQLGRYEIENERAHVWYSDGPCESTNVTSGNTNCECLVSKGTVLRIGVTFHSSIKVSELRIDKKKYERTAIHAYQPTATYADFTEGVVYTVRESDDTVTNIDYLPSAKDCEQVVRSQTLGARSNEWQGIIPLRSSRADVERVLGQPKSSLGDIYTYGTTDNRVDVFYSADPCKVRGASSLGTATDVVLKISVSPRKTVLVQDLSLDKIKFIRIRNNHPENWVHYLNSAEGIRVDATLDNGSEEVTSITYQPTAIDREWRCGSKPKNEANKP